MDSSNNITVSFKKIEDLTRWVEQLEKVNKLLKRDNVILKDKLAKYENPKNSNDNRWVRLCV